MKATSSASTSQFLKHSHDTWEGMHSLPER